MLYNFVADGFHIKKLCSRNDRNALLDGKRPFCFFEHSSVGLGATCAVHRRLIGKRIVDFILVIIGLFSLDVTYEEQRAKID